MPSNPPNQKPQFDNLVKVSVSASTPASSGPKPPADPEIIIEDSATKPTDTEPPAPKTFRQKLRDLIHNKWFWMGTAVVVLMIAGGAYAWLAQPKKITRVAAKSVVKKVVPPKPTTVADPLTGLQVDPTAAQQPIVGIMIENLDPDARPQSGLGQAGVVYEALAEGGITRFLALFQEPLPTSIGPVRSLRPYYLDWGLEYDAPVAHAGGSQPALANVGTLKLKNIEALVYDGSYFFRTTDRVAPHNLYTNAAKLTALLQKLGYATAPDFTPTPRKPATTKPTPSHTVITLDFSSAGYNVQYKYDAPSDSYARFMAGAPHVDRNTGQQIMVKNVVVEEIPTSYSTQPDGKPETDYAMVGSGTALVFNDGSVTTGTWTKASDAAQTKLTDAGGQPIKLDPGNTWFEAIPIGNTVTY